MATLRTNELTVAAVAALKGYAALTAALGGAKVYSNVPQGVQAPYILMAGTSEKPWAEVFSATGDDGARECELWYEVVTSTQGLEDVETLSALAMEALTGGAFNAVPRFSACLFGQAQQPFPVEVDGVVMLTRPCSVVVYLS